MEHQQSVAKMSLQPKGRRRTRAAIYAQQRRDNETNARETLDMYLPPDAYNNTPCASTLSTRTLCAALLFLDPTADGRGVDKTHTTSAEYNQLRRDNEVLIRDRLEATLPERIFTIKITSRGDFNRTTKIMIGAAIRVRELLRDRLNQDSNHSAPMELDTTPDLVRSPTSDLENIPDNQIDRPILAQQISVTRNEQIELPIEENFSDNDEETQSVSTYLPSQESNKLPTDQDQDQDQQSHPNMAPNTRSFANLKAPATKATIQPTKTYNIDADVNTATTGEFDGIDLLANLRAEQDFVHPTMDLDLKPPRVNKKAFQSQGPWEIRLKDPKNAPHSKEYVRALEQAANRMVAKAKELAAVNEGDEQACRDVVGKAHDMCCDVIDDFEAAVNRKKNAAKRAARKERSKKEDSNWAFDP